MHRRALPIANPCDAFRPSPGRTFCDRCQTHVHDLSALTRSQALRLLEANVGKRLCVAYRTTADGTIVVRPEPRPIGVLLVALGLAACTGYAPEVQHPDELCRDAQGYEISCLPTARDQPVIPDADRDAPCDPPPGDARDVALEPPDLDEDRLVGLVRVAPETVPDAPPVIGPGDLEVVAGGISIDADIVGEIEVSGARHQGRRQARRERRAARGR